MEGRFVLLAVGGSTDEYMVSGHGFVSDQAATDAVDEILSSEVAPPVDCVFVCLDMETLEVAWSQRVHRLTGKSC